MLSLGSTIRCAFISFYKCICTSVDYFYARQVVRINGTDTTADILNVSESEKFALL